MSVLEGRDYLEIEIYAYDTQFIILTKRKNLILNCQLLEIMQFEAWPNLPVYPVHYVSAKNRDETIDDLNVELIQLKLNENEKEIVKTGNLNEKSSSKLTSSDEGKVESQQIRKLKHIINQKTRNDSIRKIPNIRLPMHYKFPLFQHRTIPWQERRECKRSTIDDQRSIVMEREIMKPVEIHKALGRNQITTRPVQKYKQRSPITITTTTKALPLRRSTSESMTPQLRAQHDKLIQFIHDSQVQSHHSPNQPPSQSIRKTGHIKIHRASSSTGKAIVRNDESLHYDGVLDGFTYTMPRSTVYSWQPIDERPITRNLKPTTIIDSSDYIEFQVKCQANRSAFTRRLLNVQANRQLNEYKEQIALEERQRRREVRIDRVQRREHYEELQKRWMALMQVASHAVYFLKLNTHYKVYNRLNRFRKKFMDSGKSWASTNSGWTMTAARLKGVSRAKQKLMDMRKIESKRIALTTIVKFMEIFNSTSLAMHRSTRDLIHCIKRIQKWWKNRSRFTRLARIECIRTLLETHLEMYEEQLRKDSTESSLSSSSLSAKKLRRPGKRLKPSFIHCQLLKQIMLNQEAISYYEKCVLVEHIELVRRRALGFTMIEWNGNCVKETWFTLNSMQFEQLSMRAVKLYKEWAAIRVAVRRDRNEIDLAIAQQIYGNDPPQYGGSIL